MQNTRRTPPRSRCRSTISTHEQGEGEAVRRELPGRGLGSEARHAPALAGDACSLEFTARRGPVIAKQVAPWLRSNNVYGVDSSAAARGVPPPRTGIPKPKTPASTSPNCTG